ncbi:MAG TPA: type I-U CRISPR-associated protein Csb2, partial [Myxococcota bacterium]|nr:type I-U CRISPR-associated protein Csb2 [Myxococcota bacterium]
MSELALLVQVHLHEPRYHGQPEWPPSPARVFQALVAGASRRLAEPEVAAAFRWLEGLAPPVIGAPRSRQGQEVLAFVPNNDLDAVAGDPERIASLRTGKRWRARLLEEGQPLRYAWSFEGPRDAADRLVELAAGAYQLGRGVDMAWADARVLDHAELPDALDGAVIHTPAAAAGGDTLACPGSGSFDGLARRFHASRHRFSMEGAGRAAIRVFAQPPKVAWTMVAYDAAPARFVFDLRDAQERFAPVALERSHTLTVAIRDAAAARLAGHAVDVDAALIGRRPGEVARAPIGRRVRIVPLPSIGHPEVDPSLRRVLVEVPQGGPLRSDDVRWAFSGLDVDGRALVPSADDGMLPRFMEPSSRWRSVTPLALPASRRRSQGAAQRAHDEEAAAAAVRAALRHAGVSARPSRIAVQREPLLPKGERAEAFEATPRFGRERLWHAEVWFEEPVSGPMVLGDGRFLGLGLMVPARARRPVIAWQITGGLEEGADPLGLAAALRRAMMALAQDAWGKAQLPSWITGHEDGGSSARGHQHLTFAADLPRARLLVLGSRDDP